MFDDGGVDDDNTLFYLHQLVQTQGFLLLSSHNFWILSLLSEKPNPGVISFLAHNGT